MGVPKWEEGAKRIFWEIMAKIFANWMKDVIEHIQETQWTSSWLPSKMPMSQHDMVKQQEKNQKNKEIGLWSHDKARAHREVWG
jgi:hypothetical protein